MSRLILDDYIHLFMKDNQYTSLSSFDDNVFKSQITNYRELPKSDEEHFIINWGECTPNGYRSAIIETGFFFDAVHLDRNGLYQFSSLNLNGTKDIISNYTAPVEFPAIRPLLEPKLRQPSKHTPWEHVVLACQHPTDRSITKVGTTSDYFRFVEDACKYYGKKLFLKIHPVNNKETEAILREIASKHGCEIDRTNVSVIDNCEFVVTYNSTFVIDSILRNKPVNHYAPGYFWKTDIVNYTNREFRSTAKELDIEYAEKFLSFLVWKYCFHRKDTMERWNEIFKSFKDNPTHEFALPENNSYAYYILNFQK